MDNAYVSSLFALHIPHYGSWEIARFLRERDNVTVNKLTEYSRRWNKVPLSQRHDFRLQLREQHPEEFASAAASLCQASGIETRIRCAIYLPNLWPLFEDHFLSLDRAGGFGWGAEFVNADDAFLATVPEPIYRSLLPELAEYWWWKGAWNRERRDAASRVDETTFLQFALLGGNPNAVEPLLTNAMKRRGYAFVFDFLGGEAQSAYLALKKLISRRKQGVRVFESWVALWARLIALSQGDAPLFNDRRLDGNPDLESALLSLSLNNTPTTKEVELGPGLADLALWIARRHHLHTLNLRSEVIDYWTRLELAVVNDQLQKEPSAPLLSTASQEEPWQTFLRLLSAQAQILAEPVSPVSKSSARNGALLWHLFAPEIVFYHDKSAQAEAAPESLSGRHVNSKTLFSRMPNYLDDHDRLAMAKVRFSQAGAAMLTAEVLRLLQQHPRVYIRQRKVQLSERVQRLRLEQEPQGLRLRLWPEIPPERDYLLEESGHFWTRSPVGAQLRGLLQDHAPIPNSAEKELADVLAKWGEFIEVEAPSGLAPLEQARLWVDLLLLRARPYSRGFRFEWLVGSSDHSEYRRPLAERRERERLVDGESTFLVLRDFIWEEQQMAHYLALCPTLVSDPTFRVDSLDELLNLLQECQLAGLAVEWPEGAVWKVRRAESLSVAVSQSIDTDWFSLEGGLHLAEGETLDLQSALAAARLVQGNYMQLGENDFIRLTSELKEQLEALADLADTEKPRIPKLAVPSLAELEINGLTSDAAFRERLESFRECADFVATVPRRLQAELRDYQLEGYRWLARHARMGTGACLADDMGLGKTLQAITLMLSLRSEGPHLVVCPLSVLAQWEQQIELFAPTLRAGQDRQLKGLKAGDVVLCSYGVLLRDIKKLSRVQWAVAVLDEAQAIKNPQSKTARCAFQLLARVRVATTGTPIENRLSELWSLFAFLNPGLLGSLSNFRKRYEQPGAARSRLRRLVAPFLLRRLKSQVLSELPPRTEITLKVSLGEAELQLYEKLRSDAQRDIEGSQNFELLAHLTRLRQACCHPRLLLPDSRLVSSKLEALLELLEQLSEGRHRALVFSQFTRFLDLVQEQLELREVNYQRLDGGTSAAERKRRVAEFQDGEGEVFLISLKAGGTGLNLTGADYVIHLDPWWNPAVQDQASDRAHRIGQRRPVTVYKLVAENTLEEKVVRLHGHKRELAQSILEGNEKAVPLSAEELRELLRMA